MQWWEAILYGAVQGVTEYLPVSSSAHLILLPHWLGKADPGLAFDVFLHLGTLFSTLIYFRRDWLSIWRQARGASVPGLPPRAWALIGAATIPALIAGAALHGWVANELRGVQVIVWTLALGGVALVIADRFLPVRTTLDQLSLGRALGVGIAQCFALVPGMSRSGSTLIGGRLIGLDRASAARFSFLLSAPVTAAAVVYELKSWSELGSSGFEPSILLLAAFSSFAFGWLAIDGLLKLLRRFGFLSFAIYRVILALVVYQVLMP